MYQLLIFLPDTPEPLRFPLEKSLFTLGRDDANDVVIKNSYVSRFHLKFSKTKNGYEMVDLNSHNGIEVDGARVKHCLLSGSEEIQIGVLKGRFEKVEKPVVIPQAKPMRFDDILQEKPEENPEEKVVETGHSIPVETMRVKLDTGLSENETRVEASEARLENLLRQQLKAETQLKKMQKTRAHLREEIEKMRNEVDVATRTPLDEADPGTFRGFCEDLIKKIDLLDDLRVRFEEHEEVSEQLGIFRESLMDVLQRNFIRSYSFESGTPIDVRMRKRIFIVDTRTEAPTGTPVIFSTLRPGYLFADHTEGNTILRKAEVIVAN